MQTWARPLRRFAPPLRTLVAADRGNVAILFAIVLPVVVGGLGYGVETTLWYMTRLRVQTVADAAAYAAGLEARAGANYADIRLAAERAAADNGFTDTSVIDVNNPPSTGGGSNAVEVIITRDLDRVFTAVFDSGKVNVRGRAVATYNRAADACVLALHPTAGNAVNVSGSSDVTLVGCSVMANSVASDAINVQGAAKITADCLISVGGVSMNGGVTMSKCPAPITQAPPVADPFRDVPIPATPLGCKSDNGPTRSAGRYCNGMSLKNDVALESGVYVIEGGDFDINAKANVTGTDVTFYLKSGVHLTFNGNAEIKISAPTSGTYKGMLLFGDRNTTGNIKLNGTSASQFTGAIYFKNQNVAYQGNFSGKDGCVQVVGRTVEWTGNATIKADCSHLNMGGIPAMSIVELTE